MARTMLLNVLVASMRPRLITAENLHWTGRSNRLGSRRFNEAAAHHRGERRLRPRRLPRRFPLQ